MPMIAVIGVRISWLMLARNSRLRVGGLFGLGLGPLELAHELREAPACSASASRARLELARVCLQLLVGGPGSVTSRAAA